MDTLGGEWGGSTKAWRLVEEVALCRTLSRAFSLQLPVLHAAAAVPAW